MTANGATAYYRAAPDGNRVLPQRYLTFAAADAVADSLHSRGVVKAYDADDVNIASYSRTWCRRSVATQDGKHTAEFFLRRDMPGDPG